MGLLKWPYRQAVFLLGGTVIAGLIVYISMLYGSEIFGFLAAKVEQIRR